MFKSRMWMVGLAAVAIATTSVRLNGIFVRFETAKVPVARLAANLEKRLLESPASDDLHLQLARLYGMAYAANADEVAVSARSGRPDEVWFGHDADLIPYGRAPGTASRSEASRQYFEKSLQHYRAAVRLNTGNLLARLGYGWTLERSGDRSGAIAEYRQVIERAWPKERERRGLGIGERFYTHETAGYLIPLLDPRKDAAEIAELRGRMDRLERMPRAITPIAIPLKDGAAPRTIVDLDAQVRFDADGSGRPLRWTWISAEAGWLVYDADGHGVIASALQWFGNVTFWLFWNNGYEALCALDDDGDGELKGRELRFLAIWQDADRDGVSDAGEVRALGREGIVALSCAFTPGDGLLVAATSPQGVRFADGRVRPTYDVIIRPAWSVSAPEP
jgi:hypothetical protein